MLITIDTIRADYLSCNGSTKVKTPNLDDLANRGVNFTRARTPVPLTLPSHASIMTALYPPAHGVRDNGTYKLSESHTTLAELLKKSGYNTASFVGSFILDHRFGLAQGFDIYNDSTWKDISMQEKSDAERDAQTVYSAFHQWFGSYQSSEPFFVWIHFYDPHAPYTPPAPYRTRYAKNAYAGEVAYTDAVIGSILRNLESRNLLNKSVLAIVGDHGEGLGQHQEENHSVLIYNSTLHVPMMIVSPGLIPEKKVLSELCRTIDLAPTLLDYLGIQNKFGNGISLRNSIEGKKSSEPILAYSESLYPKLNLGWSELYGLEDTRYHFILAPKSELYDVIQDPGEKQNRIQQLPEVVKKFEGKVKELSQGVNPEGQSRIVETVDPETKEKLESLGYVTASPTPSKPSLKKIDPKDKMSVWNEIQIGLYQFSKSDYDRAVRTFEGILKTDKDILLVYDYLGSIRMTLRQWPEAVQIYEQALARGIEWSGLHMNLGLIHYYQKQFDKAEQELEKAITLDSLNVSAHYHLGNVMRARQKLQRAVEHYQRALEINPAYVYAKNGLGMAYASMKRDDDALLAFREAIKIDASNALAYFNLAIQLERMNQPTEALEAYRKFMSLSNSSDFVNERQRATVAIRRLEKENH